MAKSAKEHFEAWWDRVKDGCPLTDTFELGVVKEHAEKAYLAGIMLNKRKDK